MPLRLPQVPWDAQPELKTTIPVIPTYLGRCWARFGFKATALSFFYCYIRQRRPRYEAHAQRARQAGTRASYGHDLANEIYPLEPL